MTPGSMAVGVDGVGPCSLPRAWVAGFEGLVMAAATVSVLFTDLVGSTALLSRVGEERAEVLRREHFGLLREAIAKSVPLLPHLPAPRDYGFRFHMGGRPSMNAVAASATSPVVLARTCVRFSR